MLSINPPRSTLSWLGLKLLSITLIALSLSACFEEAPQANPRAKDVTVSTATNFARAPASIDFTALHALLSSQEHQRYSAWSEEQTSQLQSLMSNSYSVFHYKKQSSLHDNHIL